MTEKLQVEFEVESEDFRWNEYGIVEKYLNYDGERTKFKAIVKENRLVNLVSKRYTVIPNELLIEDVVPLIERFGYEQLDSLAKDIAVVRYMQYFIKPKLEKVDNEGIKLGMLLRNSIDGSLSLGLEGFSYRTLCSNGVIMGKESVYSFTKKHMGSVKDILSHLEEGVALVNKTSLQILEKYQYMMKVEFNKEKYGALKKLLPKKDLVDIARRIGTGTDWDAFNSVTQSLWHNSRGNMINQYGKMQVVNKVFGI